MKFHDDKFLEKKIERSISDRIDVEVSADRVGRWFLTHLEYHGFPYDNKKYDDKNVFFILGLKEAREFINLFNRQVSLMEERENRRNK